MQIQSARALITGGARGMGRCFVEQLVAEGAQVAFCDVDAEAVATTATATGATGIVADVSSEADVARLFDEATAALGGPVTLLVNNAGILRDGLLVKKDRTTGEVTPLSLHKWNQVLSVNLTGPFLCTRELASRAAQAGHSLADGPHSVVINMSSISRFGNLGQSNYSATKAALVADTTIWAKELARYGVRVGAIAPGFIATPMVASMPPKVLEKVIRPVPLQRLGQPEEIWQAVRFIASCDYFNGRVVEVDGGLRL